MKTPHYAQEAGLPWATVDLHCHTTLSDGCKTARELVDAAINKAPVNAGHVELLAVTDHDAVNDEAVALLKKEGIDTCEAAEISACDYENARHSLHLTYYARRVAQEIRDVLEGVREARRDKVRRQCVQLAKRGFEIRFEDVTARAAQLGMRPDNVNNLHLALALLENPRNVGRAEAILEGAVREGPLTREAADAAAPDPRDPLPFIKAFLRSDGALAHVGSVAVPDYEPGVEECGRLAKKHGGLLAVAHPHFTYADRGVLEFLRRAQRFAEWGINGVELGSLADARGERTYETQDKNGRPAKKTVRYETKGVIGNGKHPEGWPADELRPIAARNWRHAVGEAAAKFHLFTTLGSDYHGDQNEQHGELGELHPSFYDGSVAAPKCLLDRVNAYRRDFLKALDA